MQNRITFSNVIGVLLENKKKTYAQYQMIEDIFYDCLCNMDLFEKDDFEKNVTYSRWCTGDCPIPKEILSFYDNAGFDGIRNNIQDDVIPNLINIPATRELLLELVTDSVDVIGAEKADEFAMITDNAELITALIRYAILNDHDSRHTLLSPDLSDTSLDYGICKLSRGIIDMMEGKPEPAEMNLLGAESIIGNAMGTDNDYMKTTYRYLNNLYARRKKSENTIKYRDKFPGVKQEISRQSE